MRRRKSRGKPALGKVLAIRVHFGPIRITPSIARAIRRAWVADTMQTDISKAQRYNILFAAFLGWLLAGVQLAVASVVMRDAAKDLLGTGNESNFGQWFGLSRLAIGPQPASGQ